MKKFWLKLKTFIPTKRKLAQLYFALLFNANIKGFISGNIYQGTTKQMCVPGINCYSCPGAIGACPLGSLQGSFSADKSTLFYVGGILLLYSVIFGRMICGWLCPFGFIQELLYKIKTPKLKKSRITGLLSFLKYVILIFFVFIVPIIYALRDTPLPAFCKYICPAGTLEGGIGLLANKVNESYFSMLGPLITWKFALMVSIIVACIFIFRMFCRFICPLGALYGLFNKISFFGVKVEDEKCVDCNKCTAHCNMDVKKVGDAECIACGECIDVCPTKAIVWKGSQIFIRKSELPEVQAAPEKSKKKTVVRAVSCFAAVAVLIAAIAFYWSDGKEKQEQSSYPTDESGNIEYGNEKGDYCYGAELEIITAEGIAEGRLDPSKTGRITVINFWGTWCTPCVNELPYFDRIASEYSDTVSVVAIHTNMVSETAPEYIGNYYKNSKITFLRDSENEGYYATLGGRGTYPYTVVINAEGKITEIFFEALEYEDLKAAVDAAK
ncbi:MAG: 4Fe-4S binding protein [Clostridia bacterium]|nr:4Fe-4S binding protein [Clostridia bacterium]